MTGGANWKLMLVWHGISFIWVCFNVNKMAWLTVMAGTNAIHAGCGDSNTMDKVAAKSSIVWSVKVLFSCGALFFSALFTTGCHTPAQTAALTAGVMGTGIAMGATMPSHEVEEVYYLGVFDPNEQVPTTIYRVRVHGQSSIWNSTRFASGWVPAKFIDSLGSQVGLDPNGTDGANITAAAAGQEADLQVGRRLWMFGPEGFRVAPADYRLAIVMSADPSKFFNAMDQMLGITAAASQSDSNSPALQADLLTAYQQLLTAREKLQSVKIQP
jgi:hypothetical protein